MLKVDGTHYPPRTIQHYLLGIQQHIKEHKLVQINFFDDSDFSALHKFVASILKALAVLLTKPRPSRKKMKKSLCLTPETLQSPLNCLLSAERTSTCAEVLKSVNFRLPSCNKKSWIWEGILSFAILTASTYQKSEQEAWLICNLSVCVTSKPVR